MRQNRSLIAHLDDTRAAWASHKRMCGADCPHAPEKPLLCLYCEMGLCRQGCQAVGCTCKNTLHLRNSIDYEAERPR